jgi:hypothetical protein
MKGNTMHPDYAVEKRAAANMAQTGMDAQAITTQLRRQYGIGLYEARTIARYAVHDRALDTVATELGSVDLDAAVTAAQAPEVPAYVTEDHVTVHEGDTVYDYYGMEVVIIGKPSGSDGWFDTQSVRDPSKRSSSGMLNGARICTMQYARRRGFPGA